jgi:hypothetical protein
MFPHINQLNLSAIKTRYETIIFNKVLSSTGQYIWQNEQKQLFNALPNALYIIDKLGFGANVEQVNFNSAITNPISLFFQRNSTKTNINNTPFEITQFWGDYELSLPFKGAENNNAITSFNPLGQFTGLGEPINISISGVLNQTANLVTDGISNIQLIFSFKIFEIQDSNFISKYWDQ